MRHNPNSPRHAAASPGQPRTVQAPETQLDQITGDFFARHVFGPGRAALLAAQLAIGVVVGVQPAPTRATSGRP